MCKNEDHVRCLSHGHISTRPKTCNLQTNDTTLDQSISARAAVVGDALKYHGYDAAAQRLARVEHKRRHPALSVHPATLQRGALIVYIKEGCGNGHGERDDRPSRDGLGPWLRHDRSVYEHERQQYHEQKREMPSKVVPFPGSAMGRKGMAG